MRSRNATLCPSSSSLRRNSSCSLIGFMTRLECGESWLLSTTLGSRRRSTSIAQQLPQFLAALENIPLHVLQAAAHQLGNILLRPLLNGEQHQGQTLLFWQLGHGCL